jgi:hypothetical protein
MRDMSGVRRLVAGLSVFIFAAFVAIGGAGATSANTDASDIWWNPNESGWGLEMTNTGTHIFAAMFIYGSDGKPTWVVANMDKTGAAAPTFTGPLVATSGPPFNVVPFEPNLVTRQPVGTMTFVLTSVSTGVLTYTLNGTPVTKTVQRQPLTLDDYSGTFASVITLTATGCTDPANNNPGTTGNVIVTTTQTGPTMSQSWNLGNTTCTYNGTYSQLGRMGTFASTWTCASGGSGTMTMFQMSNQPGMFMGRVAIVNTGNGCNLNGELTGLVRRG